MKFKIQKIIGGVLILIGFVFILNSYFGITGFIVAESTNERVGSILGLVFMIGGLILVMSELEKKIEIYQDMSKKGDDSYYLNDPNGLFDNNGIVEYRKFVKRCKEIENNPELWQITRRTYVGPLIKIADKEEKYSDIAKKCLKVLNLEYLEGSESGSILTKEESSRIRSAFRGWNGKLNSKQKRTLKDCGLKFKKGKPHSKIISEYGSTFVTNSPSDQAHGGKNMANNIEKIYAETKLRNQSGQ